MIETFGRLVAASLPARVRACGRRANRGLFAVLCRATEIWRAGQNKTANTYAIEIAL